MNFFKKLFGGKKSNDSEFDKYRKELNELGLSTLEDLENIVKPLIRETTEIKVNISSNLPKNSELKSHFGGKPYFENGEQWPTSKSGKPMDFICQIYNKDKTQLPNAVKLVQLFYDWDEFPWDTKSDGWKVKIYKSINTENQVKLEPPISEHQLNYCEVTLEQSYSLPDWEGIDTYSENTSKLSCVLDEDEPWEPYQNVVTKLIGEKDFRSQLGGYPNWVQGEETPKGFNGEKLNLLFQIDSEDNANLMWGDVGLIYVFYEAKKEQIEFKLQCH